MREPLDRGFNVAVRHIASRLFPTGFDTGEQAPSSLAELRAHVARAGRMLVFNGASDTSIFQCAETNHCFRAWHDWCHLKGLHEFDASGEQSVVVMQAQHLIALYGEEKSRIWRFLLSIEILGQAEYHRETGEFPADQYAFTVERLPSVIRQQLQIAA